MEGVSAPSCPQGHKAMGGLIPQQERPGQSWNEEQPGAQGGCPAKSKNGLYQEHAEGAGEDEMMVSLGPSF